MKAHVIMKMYSGYPEDGSDEPFRVFVDPDKAIKYCNDANNSPEMTLQDDEQYWYQIVTVEME